MSLKMRNCNLELRLFPPAAPLPLNFPVDDDQNRYHPTSVREPSLNSGQQKQLTIFYGGKVCVCDATEFQARAIILLAAKREMEERKFTRNMSASEESCCSPSQMLLSNCPRTGGLSFKRSLQRFLQKRNHRIQQASSPYHR